MPEEMKTAELVPASTSGQTISSMSSTSSITCNLPTPVSRSPSSSSCQLHTTWLQTSPASGQADPSLGQLSGQADPSLGQHLGQADPTLVHLYGQGISSGQLAKINQISDQTNPSCHQPDQPTTFQSNPADNQKDVNPGADVKASVTPHRPPSDVTSDSSRATISAAFSTSTVTNKEASLELLAPDFSTSTVASKEASLELLAPDFSTSTVSSKEASLELLAPDLSTQLRQVERPPFRRAISNINPTTVASITRYRKSNSFDGVNPLQTRDSQQTNNNVAADEAVHRVRFFIGASKLYSSSQRTSRSSDLFTDDTTKGFPRSRLSSFKNFFRGSTKRKKRKSLELSEEGLKIDGAIIRKASPLLSRKRPTSVENLDPTDAPEEHHVIVSPGDTDESDLDIVDDRVLIKPPVQAFRRTQSTKSRQKPMLEDEELDSHRITRSVTVGNFLPRSLSYLHPPLRVSRSFCNWTVDSREDGGEDNVSPDDGNTLTRRGLFDRGNNRNGSRKIKKGRIRSGSLRKTLGRLFTKRRKSEGGFNPTHRGSQGGIVGHSLASVELGSWAARGSRRGSAIPPFCATISPTEASSRTEILQTISSSIIHLFQRKPLKDNELGVLQDHVRFLINSEAGGLVHEYYKDQLLRKGMIILREKIKNEQGLELLKQLGETWDYFFKEILPILQAILYPLTSSLGKDETVRSLSLLAFRNIVVLKVSIKEALDSVSKNEYPSSIQQMLLVLQSIQDNVFLSENQFLLEKLVARVVCPYLGQRGVYEGSPDPVIKVKLKPIPFNIPSVIVSDNDKIHSKSPFKMETPSNYSPVSSRKGLQEVRKLKPVLEHIYDGGRRHSIMS